MISREEILKRFEQWLDGALAHEEPPTGIDSEILAALTADPAHQSEGAGAYGMWSAITALTQEVKLQGRAFKELNTTLGAQMAERERVIQRQAEQRSRKEILDALLDLRDRLERGLEAAKANLTQPHRQTWLQRLAAKHEPAPEPARATVEALVKGYELSLERLDQTLEDFNVRRIRALGEPFDPRRMNAVDKQPSTGVAEGTVLEVYRSGFEWNGEVFRPAQVKVSAGEP